MADESHVISALYAAVQTMIDNSQHSFVQGVWNFAESVDSNLSSVTIDDKEFRYVRKLSHVTGLVAGDAVLLTRSPELPLTVIGKVVGDITLAEEV